MGLQDTYNLMKSTPSDTNEHFDTLKEYAAKVDHVTEMGVRDGVTTFALLAGKPKKMRSYDVREAKNIAGIREAAKEVGTDFEFLLKNVLAVEIEQTDLLFIDTLHTYWQLKQELAKHSHRAKKYMIMHDTETFGSRDEQQSSSMKQGLMTAILEFLEVNKCWRLEKHYKNCNGLTVLERTDNAR